MPNRLPEEIHDPHAGEKAFANTLMKAFEIAQGRVREKKLKQQELGEQLKMMIMQNMLQTGQTQGLPAFAETMGVQGVQATPQQGVPSGMIPTGGTVSGRGVSQDFVSPEMFAQQQLKAQPKTTGKARTFIDIRKRAEDQASKLATKTFNIGALSKMTATPKQAAEYMRSKTMALIKQYSKEEGISLPSNWEKNYPKTSHYEEMMKEQSILDIKTKFEMGRIKENKLEKMLQRQGIKPTPEIIERITGRKKQTSLEELFK